MARRKISLRIQGRHAEDSKRMDGWRVEVSRRSNRIVVCNKTAKIIKHEKWNVFLNGTRPHPEATRA